MSATLGYSSLFTSGLLAPNPPSTQASRSPSPSTPRAATATLALDDTTPTAPTSTRRSVVDESQVLPSISIPSSDDSRPRLRRRRSSLAGSASPLTPLKSSTPTRAAAASLQRSLRARSGSDASILSAASGASMVLQENAPAGAKPTGILGRLRSGSLGTALRSRRGLRRFVPAIPALPPPTAPLPAVPPVPTLTNSPPGSPLSTGVGSPSSTTSTGIPRQPLSRRTQTSNNYELAASPFTVGGVSPMCVVEDEDVFPVGTAALLKRAQHEMQIDYPSPVDGNVPFEWRT